jgi:hypothetical protein
MCMFVCGVDKCADVQILRVTQLASHNSIEVNLYRYFPNVTCIPMIFYMLTRYFASHNSHHIIALK